MIVQSNENDNLERTIGEIHSSAIVSDKLYVTVRAMSKTINMQVVEAKNEQTITIGSDPSNLITINSRLVSRKHGALRHIDHQWYYADLGSTNGTFIDGKLYRIAEKHEQAPQWIAISFPCILKIDHPLQSLAEHVELLLSPGEEVQSKEVRLSHSKPCTIGRDPSCIICLPRVQVSRIHAAICWENQQYILHDNNSTNGLTVNGKSVRGSVELHLHDAIRIGRDMLVYMRDYVQIIWAEAAGVAVEARGLSKTVGGKKPKIILDNVSLTIEPGEMVAIIGGSGAGKTTLMNALSGFTSKTAGTVTIDGQDLDSHYSSLKSIIGYVPQQDIVYESLSLWRMLEYTAKMRMPEDSTKAEKKKRITEVLHSVRMWEQRDTLISKLSGGQRKRASIAVELLADPSFLLLDEPTSGLDAGTEESLMKSMRQLAQKGKTVLLVTHSTLNLDICDKLIIMGRGGKQCFMGTLEQALQFFRVERIAQIYEKLDNEASKWASEYQSTKQEMPSIESQPSARSRKSVNAFSQYRISTARYAEIMLNSPKFIFSALGQAVVFALVLTLVSNDNLYVTFHDTQTVCFVTACLSMWMGLFLAIQEITKERSILRREYMGNLKLTPYVGSKVTVLAVISALQAILFQACIYLFSNIAGKNLPDTSILASPFVENGLTIFLISLASACMGLMVSALSKRPEGVTPYVLMPQIVLSGVLFDLGGIFHAISRLVFTFWGNRALCSSANVNLLGQWQLGPAFENVAEYSYTAANLLGSWITLLILGAVMLCVTSYSLRGLSKDER